MKSPRESLAEQAAPELLEALQALYDLCKSNAYPRWTQDMAAATKKAEAAIRKAKGE